MTIEQIKYFVDVVETNSFTKAGIKNYISQSAVTFAIKSLERELNCVLFIREKGRLTLTEVGSYLYSLSKPIIADFVDIPVKIEEYKFKNSVVKVGVPPMLGAFVFAPIFEQFIRKQPSINIKITELASSANQLALINGDIDVALTVIYKGEINGELEYKKIGETELLLAVSPFHPLAKRERVSIKDIKEQPLVLLKEDSLQYKVVMELFNKSGISPNIRLLSDQILTIKKVLKRGSIGAFLFNQIIEEDDELVGIHIDDNYFFDIVVATKKERTLTKAAEKFLEFVLPLK